jgi:HSP20 family protein
MNQITRWDPFREMIVMRNTMDRLFDRFFDNEISGWEQTSTLNLALDVVEKPEEFVVKASLPGVKPEDVDVTFNDNVLTIKGEISSEEEKEDSRYHLRERRYGSFARSLSLPRGINSDAIEAKFSEGVLTLRLPKSEEVKPRRIAIQSASSKGSKKPEMIEGKVADVKSKN